MIMCRTPWGAAALAPRVAPGFRPCDGPVDHATSPRQPRSITCAARAGSQAIVLTCLRRGSTHRDGCVRGRAEESPPGDREDGPLLILAGPEGSVGGVAGFLQAVGEGGVAAAGAGGADRDGQ